MGVTLKSITYNSLVIEMEKEEEGISGYNIDFISVVHRSVNSGTNNNNN